MKKFTRLMALLLALLMVFALCACDGSGDGGDTSSKKSVGTTSGTTSGDSADNTSSEEAEIFDMGGKTIKIACWWAPLPTADASTEESRLHYYQLEEVKKNYNVKFEEIVVQQPDMKVNFDAHLMSGDIWADIMYLRAEQADQYAKAGSLKDLTNIIPHDSIEYNQNIRERFTIDGKTYAFTYYMDNFDCALAFNKAIFDKAGVAYPYELVHQKKWTFDAFVDTIKKTTIKDASGNITAYGFYGYYGGWESYLYTALNKQFVDVDANGKYYSNANDPQVQNFLNRYRDLMLMDGYVYLPPSDASWNDGTEKFAAGRIAIAGFSMSGGPNGLKDMVDPWGVLPKPVLTEGQDWKGQNETQNVQCMPAALEDEWARQVAYVYHQIYKTPYNEDEYEANKRAVFETQLDDEESVNIVYDYTYNYPVVLKGSTMMNAEGYWETVAKPMNTAMRGDDTIARTIGTFNDALNLMIKTANGE